MWGFLLADFATLKPADPYFTEEGGAGVAAEAGGLHPNWLWSNIYAPTYYISLKLQYLKKI